MNDLKAETAHADRVEAGDHTADINIYQSQSPPILSTRNFLTSGRGICSCKIHSWRLLTRKMHQAQREADDVRYLVVCRMRYHVLWV